MQRATFIHTLATAIPALALVPNIAAAQTNEKPSPLHPDMVKDFVAAGHNNLEKVKQLLAESPNLLYATWDWGGGDFETALEGAGHVGNKDIANYLIQQGARANLFVMTMLGNTAFVKSFVEANPGYLTARGPHGFSFLHHAQKGGDDARELLAYFESKGLKETRFKLY